MSQEVLYNIWKEGVLQEKRQALAGKFALTELDRQYIDTEDNIDAFAAQAGDRLGEIYSYIKIGHTNGGNWNGLLTLYKRRLDYLLTDYINRLVESREYAVDEIIDQMEKWVDTTTEIISSIIDEQKADVIQKGATKGTINPTTTKKRLEAWTASVTLSSTSWNSSSDVSCTTSLRWTLPNSVLMPRLNQLRKTSRVRRKQSSLASPLPSALLTPVRKMKSSRRSGTLSLGKPETRLTSFSLQPSKQALSSSRRTMQ